MAFNLRPIDETFFTSAPQVFTEAFDIANPAPEVWSELTADAALSFCRSLRGARWTSPRPFGVGTTRTMPALYGLLVIDERYFRWEEGRRQSFYVERANLPMFKSLAEDYLLEPTGPDTCRFTWTIAADPTVIGKLGSPLNKSIVEGIFRDTRRHFS
ncbi:MAG: SRPBCC family protein [Aeromicrobium sp.]